MTRAAIEMLLARHRDAFLCRDVEALTLTHTAEGTFESPAHGIVTGRDKIRDVYRYWYTAFPDLILSWDSVLIDPPRASFIWTFSGTAAGPFFGEVKVGSRVQMIGAAQYAFSDEGITAARHVFDFSGTLMRTGVLKVKPA